jgi:hypothetical protein
MNERKHHATAHWKFILDLPSEPLTRKQQAGILQEVVDSLLQNARDFPAHAEGLEAKAAEIQPKIDDLLRVCVDGKITPGKITMTVLDDERLVIGDPRTASQKADDEFSAETEATRRSDYPI